jgi:hypothetical protein
MVLDVNAELFDPKGGDRIAVVLASSLGANADDGYFNPKYNVSLPLFLFGCNSTNFLMRSLVLPRSLSGFVYYQSSLMDSYDYVMHGKVFQVKHIENQRIEVQASFGGLLMRIRGEQAHLEAFTVDMT